MFTTTLDVVFYLLFLHVLTAPMYSSILFFFPGEILYENQTTSVQSLFIHIGSYSQTLLY